MHLKIKAARTKRVIFTLLCFFMILLMPLETVSGNNNINYQYDSNGRLDKVCLIWNCSLYGYDLNGNLISKGKSRTISLTNPSFENGVNDLGYYISNGDIEIDTVNANTGTKSVKVTPSPSDATWQFKSHNFGSDIAGQKFTVSAYVKTASLVGGVRLRIYWADSSGNWIWSNIEDSTVLSGTKDWTQINATAIAPYGATSATAMFVAFPGSGTYWIDSLEMREELSFPIPIQNSSFEYGIVDLGYYISNGDIEIDTVNANTGTKSVKVTPSPSDATWQFKSHNFETNIAGQKFTVSAYVKTASLAGGVRLRIYWADSSGNWIWSNIEDSTVLSGTKDWIQISATAIAPYGAMSATAMFVAFPGSGTYWIDSLEMREEPSFPVSLPNPSFENGLNDLGYYVSNGSINIDTTNANTGIQSVKITPSPMDAIWQFETYNARTNITGRKFTVSAYVKTSSLTGGVRLLIYWSDASGNWIWNNIC